MTSQDDLYLALSNDDEDSQAHVDKSACHENCHLEQEFDQTQKLTFSHLAHAYFSLVDAHHCSTLWTVVVKLPKHGIIV